MHHRAINSALNLTSSTLRGACTSACLLGLGVAGPYCTALSRIVDSCPRMSHMCHLCHGTTRYIYTTHKQARGWAGEWNGVDGPVVACVCCCACCGRHQQQRTVRRVQCQQQEAFRTDQASGAMCRALHGRDAGGVRVGTCSWRTEGGADR
jgi:hypothetical protein